MLKRDPIYKKPEFITWINGVSNPCHRSSCCEEKIFLSKQPISTQFYTNSLDISLFQWTLTHHINSWLEGEEYSISLFTPKEPLER